MAARANPGSRMAMLSLASSINGRNEQPRPESPHPRYLFVPTSGGKSQARSRRDLKSVRSHVMHHYLEGRGRESDWEQDEPPPQGPVVDPTHAENVASTKGTKMSFRLKRDGLERRVPYREKRQKARQDQVERGKTQRRTRIPTDGERNEELSSTATQTSLGRRHQVVKMKTKPRTTSPGLSGISTSHPDPFSVLAITILEGDSEALHRFRHMPTYPWCPVNGQSEWLPLAVSDQLVYHATMYTFTMHFDRFALLQPEAAMRAAQHQIAALHLLNERLSSPHTATSDAVLAAVAAIAHITILQGTREEAHSHMAGLKALVALRGGPASLKSGPQRLVARLASWDDLMYVETFAGDFAFEPLDLLRLAWREFEQTRHYDTLCARIRSRSPSRSRWTARAYTSRNGPEPEPVPEEPEAVLFTTLERIAVLAEIEHDSPLIASDEEQCMRRNDLILGVERALGNIVSSSESGSGSGSGSASWTNSLATYPAPDARVVLTVALAALSYVHHSLRGGEISKRNFGPLSMRLCDTLQQFDADLVEFDFARDLGVWVLATGAATAPFPVARASLLNLLRRACVRDGILTWRECRDSLQGVVWCGPADELQYRAVWDDLGLNADQGASVE